MVVEQQAQQILLTAYHLSPGSSAAQAICESCQRASSEAG